MNPKSKSPPDPKPNALSDFIRISSLKSPPAPQPCLPSKSVTTFRHFQAFRNLYAQLNSGQESDAPQPSNVVKKVSNRKLVTPTTIAVEMPMVGCDTAIIAPPLKSFKSAEKPAKEKKKVEEKKPEEKTLEKLYEMEYRVEKSNFLDDNFMDISIAQKQLEEITKLLSKRASKSLTKIPSKKQIQQMPSWKPEFKYQKKSQTSFLAPVVVDKQRKVMDTLNELNDRLRDMQEKYFTGVHVKYKSVNSSLEEIKQSISKEVDKFDDFDLTEPFTDSNVTDSSKENIDKEIEALERKLNELKRLKEIEEVKLKDSKKLEGLDIDVDLLQQKFENLKLMQENILQENQEIQQEAKEKVEELKSINFSPKVVGDVEKFFNEVSEIIQDKLYCPRKESAGNLIKREFIIKENKSLVSPRTNIDKDDSLTDILTDMELLDDTLADGGNDITSECLGRKDFLWEEVPILEKPTKEKTRIGEDKELDLSQLFPRHKDIIDIRLAAKKSKEVAKDLIDNTTKREAKDVETESSIDSDQLRIKSPLKRPNSSKANKRVSVEDKSYSFKDKNNNPKSQKESTGNLKVFKERLSNLKKPPSSTKLTQILSSEKDLDVKKTEEESKFCTKQNECTVNDIQLSCGAAKNASTFTSDIKYRRPPLAKSKFGNRKLESSIKGSKYLQMEFQNVLRSRSRDRSRPTSGKSGKSPSPDRVSKGTNKVFIPALSSTQT